MHIRDAMTLMHHSKSICLSVSVRVVQRPINCRSLLYAAECRRESAKRLLKQSDEAVIQHMMLVCDLLYARIAAGASEA